MEDLSVTRSLKKTRIFEFLGRCDIGCHNLRHCCHRLRLRRRRRRSDALRCSSPAAFSQTPALPPPFPRGGRGKRRWSSSSNYFSLASKHFNATSTNELVLFSLPRNPLRHPSSEQNRVTSSPVRSRPLSELRPLLAMRTRSQLGHPLTRSPHYFNCANGNNSPR